MTDLPQVFSPQVSSPRGLRPATALLWFMLASLVVPTGLIAIVLGLGWLALPYELLLVLRRLPLLFPAHMIASGAALILIPIAAVLRRRPAAHRVAGRLAAVAVAIGACASLPVALASEAAVAARAGFFMQGVVWLGLLIAAVTAIRRGSKEIHATLMLAMAAVASGAIWLRLTLAVANVAEWPFDRVYPVAAWACWLVPLAAVAAGCLTLPSWRSAGRNPARPSPGRC
jgi:hypothetical protein